MNDRRVPIVPSMTTDGIWREEKAQESALLVIVGEWECSSDGCWKFVVETNKLAQCIMISDDMTYAALKARIEQEFESEGSGVVCSLSYCPPEEMSMFANGKTPPVSIASNSGLQTFNNLRRTTRPLNLLVTFTQSWETESIGDQNNVVAERIPVINLVDGTPSFLNREGTDESTDADLVICTEADTECVPQVNENLQKEAPIINVADDMPLFVNTEWREDSSDAGAVNGKDNHTEGLPKASENIGSKTDNSGGIDLNSIYDSAMVARLEEIEDMARAATGSTSRKGKEKVTYPESELRLDGKDPREWDEYGRDNPGTFDNTLWSTIVNSEYRSLANGQTMVHGECSNAVRMVSLPETSRAELDTGEEVAAFLQNLEAYTESEKEEDRRDIEDLTEDYEDGENIQLSLENIYNEIIEADIVPSHDCAPCFGDDFPETQELPEGTFDLNNDAIFIGRVFRNKAEMQTTLAIYAIKRFFSFRLARSDKKRLIVKCLDKNCKWRVYGHTVGGTSQNMEVRSATLTHTCDISTRSQYGKKASCKVISEVLRSKYANGKIGPRAVDIPDIVLDELRVSISYMKAWHAKERAVMETRGSDEGSYRLLLCYLHLLKQTNAGTVSNVVTTGFGTPKCRFKYLFFALGACIEAAKFMRRVVIIDATTIKAKFRGCLLTASFQDGNFQIMPVGFGVVDAENENAWSWFFKQLGSIVPDSDDLVFVSDRHTSIYASLRKVYPLAKHACCSVHLYRNVRARYSRQTSLGYLVAKAAAAYTLGDFRSKFEEIERRSPACANYLRGIGISHWSRVYFQGKRYNIMSSNVAESLNAAMAKALEFPIVSMVETLRMMLMRWFYCRRVKATNYTGPVTPEVEEMLMKHLSESGGLSVAAASSTILQVNNGVGISYIVDLEKKTCTCRVFDSLGIPCCHALAAARATGTPIPDLVDDYYKKEVWRNAYRGVVMPVPSARDEDVPEELLNSVALPPETNAEPGRPRKRRIPSAGEITGPKRPKNRPTRCSRCFNTGHTGQPAKTQYHN